MIAIIATLLLIAAGCIGVGALWVVSCAFDHACDWLDHRSAGQ